MLHFAALYLYFTHIMNETCETEQQHEGEGCGLGGMHQTLRLDVVVDSAGDGREGRGEGDAFFQRLSLIDGPLPVPRLSEWSDDGVEVVDEVWHASEREGNGSPDDVRQDEPNE